VIIKKHISLIKPETNTKKNCEQKKPIQR